MRQLYSAVRRAPSAESQSENPARGSIEGKPTRRGLPRRKRFSLIELLVIVSIISILMCVLLPALKTARDKATQMLCANKLKQIGCAAAMYSNEYNDWIVQGNESGAAAYTAFWYYKLLDYGGFKYHVRADTQKCSFACPAESVPIVNIGYAYTHYAINIYLSGAPAWGTYASYWRKQSHSFSPSQTIFVVDMFYGPLLYYVEFFSYRHGGGGEKRAFTKSYAEADASIPLGGGKTNILFLDGHVNSMGYRELISVQDDLYPTTTYRDKALFRGFNRKAGFKIP